MYYTMNTNPKIAPGWTLNYYEFVNNGYYVLMKHELGYSITKQCSGSELDKTIEQCQKEAIELSDKLLKKNLLLNGEIKWRYARHDDVNIYFQWANDPETRRQSFSEDVINFSSHKNWFFKKINTADTTLFIFEFDFTEPNYTVPVGQIRFEKTIVDSRYPFGREAIVSLSINPHFRGRGLSSQLIKQGCKVYNFIQGLTVIYAYIKPDNQASVRAFERAGFTLSGESSKFGMPSLVYILKA